MSPVLLSHARRALLLAAATVALALATAGVAGGQSTGPTGPETTGNVTAERVRIAFPRDDGSLTPFTFELGYPLMTLVYDTLMWRDESGRPEPWLARSLDRADSGRRLTIRLRDGVRWHDGRPLTAADVAFTYDYFGRQRFHPRFTPQLRAVRRVQATTPQTVVITLRKRSPGFDDQPLSDVPILPRHLWRDLRGSAIPEGLAVGSGPYRLAEYNRGKGYRFAANRDYFLGRPRVQTLDVPFIGGFEQTLRALEARRIDMVALNLPESAQARVRGPEFKTRFGSTFTGTTLMFNTREPPFDQTEARRAVADALDLPRIARNPVIGGGGVVAADRGYLHPKSAWTTAGAVYRFEPERARAAFARLGLPPIEILAPANDPVRLEAGRQVVLALQRAGAQATLRELSPSRLAAAVGQNSGEPATFQAAVWSSPALASYDPDYLRLVFGSEEAPINFSGYRSEEFDDLADQVASASANPEERPRLVKDELDLLARDAPVIPLFFPEGAYVFRPQIYNGWTYVAGTGILDKRSFLPRVTREAARPSATPRTTTTDAGIGTLGYIALVLLGGVLVTVLVGLVSRARG